MHITPNNNGIYIALIQHKLGVAFSYLERNQKVYLLVFVKA